jgi:hypothetical protein
MALFQAPAVKSRREYPATGYQSGQVLAAVLDHVFTEDFTAASDVLEIGLLPAGAKLLSAELITGALGAGNTATLSVMDGAYADKDGTRAADTDIATGLAAHSAATPVDTADLLALAPEEKHRGLGLEMSENITAGATKTVKMLITYSF